MEAVTSVKIGVPHFINVRLAIPISKFGFASEPLGNYPLFGCHSIEVFSLPPARRSEACLTVPDWWLAFQYSHLLYVPTAPVIAYCSGLHLSGGINVG